MNSENIKELQGISNISLEFKDFDETVLLKVESKIAEITAIKENATKNFDFKTASFDREEVRKLQKHFNDHKALFKQITFRFLFEISNLNFQFYQISLLITIGTLLSQFLIVTIF